MKKIVFLFIVLVMAMLHSCQTVVPKTLIKSDLSDIGSEYVLVSNIADGILDTIFTSSEKSVESSLELQIQDPTVLTLTEGRNKSYIFVSPGQQIDLALIDSSSVIGSKNTEIAENKYLIQVANLLDSGNLRQESLENAKLESEAYLKANQELYEDFRALAHSIDSDENLNSDFKSTMLNRLKALELGNVLRYEQQYEYHNKKKPLLQEGFYEVLEDVELNPSLLTYKEGIDFGSSLNSRGVDFTKYPTVAAYFQFLYDKSNSDFADPVLRQYYKFSNLRNQIEFGSGIDGATAMIEDFDKPNLNTYFQSSLEGVVGEWKELMKGSEAPNFKGTTRDGRTVSLSDLKGRSVYVDVWATWCSPCIAEIPSLKSLENDLHDEAVEFVSISIDEQINKQKWLDFVKKEELGGTQLMANGAWQSEVAQRYNIKGIPRFILIDGDGSIVSANAPRPSSDVIKDLIEETLD